MLKDGAPAKGEEVYFSLSDRKNVESLPGAEVLITNNSGEAEFGFTPTLTDIYKPATATVMVQSQNKTATTLLQINGKAPEVDNDG